MDIKEALSILDVSPGCKPEELKSAYRKKARTTHPDRAGAGSEKLFIRVKTAYDLLILKGTAVNTASLTHSSIFHIVKV